MAASLERFKDKTILNYGLKRADALVKGGDLHEAIAIIDQVLALGNQVFQEHELIAHLYARKAYAQAWSQIDYAGSIQLGLEHAEKVTTGLIAQAEAFTDLARVRALHRPDKATEILARTLTIIDRDPQRPDFDFGMDVALQFGAYEAVGHAAMDISDYQTVKTAAARLTSLQEKYHLQRV